MELITAAQHQLDLQVLVCSSNLLSYHALVCLTSVLVLAHERVNTHKHIHVQTQIQPFTQGFSRPGKQICPFSYLIGCQHEEKGGQV